MVNELNKEKKSVRSLESRDFFDEDLKAFLLEKADHFETLDFVADDPISVPHRYRNPRDIELAGFIAASLAWGQRKTILKNALRFLERMDESPYDYLLQATDREIEVTSAGFVHRTFQPRDAKVFLHALQELLSEFNTLEAAFIPRESSPTVQRHLEIFNERFFEAAQRRGFEAGRTRKHVATPAKASASKRLNMFLRWMVRPASRGVDFGIWKQIKTHQLMIPLDVHTGNVARKLGLLHRNTNDWKAVEELMIPLRMVDEQDPVRLDFALFGLGAIEGF
ncbi:MAG: TIGR02757 family protein [Flavobacteriales bacterium]